MVLPIKHYIIRKAHTTECCVTQFEAIPTSLQAQQYSHYEIPTLFETDTLDIGCLIKIHNMPIESLTYK